MSFIHPILNLGAKVRNIFGICKYFSRKSKEKRHKKQNIPHSAGERGMFGAEDGDIKRL